MSLLITATAMAAVRWLLFCGLAMLVGCAVFSTWVAPSLRGSGAFHAVRRRVRRLARGAAALLAVVVAVRLVQQAATFSDSPQQWTSTVSLVLLQTTWGIGWCIQAIALLVAAMAAWASRGSRPERFTPMTMGAATLVLSSTPALSGHAVGAPRLAAMAAALDALHVMAGGAWMGTLAVLLLAGIPGVLAHTYVGDAEPPAALVSGLLRRFSPIALSAAGMLVLTGAFATWLHVDVPSSLWRTRYGLLLVGKMALLLLVAVVGAWNWRVATPALAGGRVMPLRRAAGLELTVGIILLAVTAVLVGTALPGEG